MKSNDTQVDGTHYKKFDIQPWDVIDDNNIPYLVGNIIKYLSRWKDKNGLKDIEKALHYARKSIENNRRIGRVDFAQVNHFIAQFEHVEQGWLHDVFNNDLKVAVRKLEIFLRDNK